MELLQRAWNDINRRKMTESEACGPEYGIQEEAPFGGSIGVYTWLWGIGRAVFPKRLAQIGHDPFALAAICSGAEVAGKCKKLITVSDPHQTMLEAIDKAAVLGRWRSLAFTGTDPFRGDEFPSSDAQGFDLSLIEVYGLKAVSTDALSSRLPKALTSLAESLANGGWLVIVHRSTDRESLSLLMSTVSAWCADRCLCFYTIPVNAGERILLIRGRK